MPVVDEGWVDDRAREAFERVADRVADSRGSDLAVAAAMIDRVVRHADVLTFKGARCRLRNRGIDTLPSIKTQDTTD